MHKKSLSHETHSNTEKGPGAARINEAYSAAEEAKLPFVRQAVICGQMLVEQRATLSSCHDDKSLSWHDGTKDASDQFQVWMASHCPKIHWRKAYRWMDAAARVIAHLEEVSHANPLVFKTLDGEQFFYSTILTMPEAEATPAMRTFQETFEFFLRNKTLTSAIAATLDGDDDPSRISRAANGEHGGEGERKDFPLFLARKFHAIGAHLGRWESMTEVQRNEALTAARNMMLGEPVKLPGRKVDLIRPAAESPWPDEFLKVILQTAQQILRGQK
jgi:hypothetical protein